MMPPKSPKPTAVCAVSPAVAVHVGHGQSFSSWSLVGTYHMKVPLLLIAVLLATGCHHLASGRTPASPRPTVSRTTHLTPEEAVSIAAHAVEQKGEHMADYPTTVILYEATSGDWWISFHRKPVAEFDERIHP